MCVCEQVVCEQVVCGCVSKLFVCVCKLRK